MNKAPLPGKSFAFNRSRSLAWWSAGLAVAWFRVGRMELLRSLQVVWLVVGSVALGGLVWLASPTDRAASAASADRAGTAAQAAARAAREALAAGNAALQRGDYATALTCYATAQRYTPDPGQVAFNAAVAHYQLGHYREAELHWQRCLLDDCITPPRRALALYNLGCALLRQATDADVARCREAVQAFRQSLAVDGGNALPEPYTSDARYNLELARLLLARARAKSKDRPPPEPSEPANPQQSPKQPELPQQPKQLPKQADDQPGQPTPSPTPGQRPTPLAKGSEQANPGALVDRPPGFGSLPTLADDDTPQQLTPADTRALLAEAARRISADRQRQFRPPGGPRDGSFPNW